MKAAEVQAMLDRIDGELKVELPTNRLPWVRFSDGYGILLGPLTGVGVVCHVCDLVKGGGMYIGLKPSDVSGHVKRHAAAGAELPDDVYRTIAERWRSDVLGRR